MRAVRECGHSHLVTLLAMLCFPSVVFPGGVVATNSQSALVAAMAGGGTVTFSFNGTIFLTNTLVVPNNTVLDATGQNVAISGSNSVQILIVNAGTTLILSNLTLRDGLAQGLDSTYIPTPGCGGAISNAGVLQAFACTFTNNGANGYSPSSFNNIAASEALGGAIYNAGMVTVSGCIFDGNWTAGGVGQVPNYPYSAEGAGGAFYNVNEAIIINSVFSNNMASGGAGCYGESPFNSPDISPGGQGGAASGGAVCNSGSLIVSNNTFAQNATSGGVGGAGAPGVVNDYSSGAPGSAGGDAGNANGGALCCLGGTNTIVNCTFWSNSATAGGGGMGGAGAGTVHEVGAQGGNGGNADEAATESAAQSPILAVCSS
jgi:hypothetical protein